MIPLVSLGLVACTATQYQQPSQLRFQESISDRTQVISVERDHKLCNSETAAEQDCPTQFYIDDIKAGDFYINNSAQFLLKPDTYNLKVKNCTDQCAVCETDVNITEIKDYKIVLTVDNQGFPLLLNTNQKMICKIQSAHYKPTTHDLTAGSAGTDSK